MPAMLMDHDIAPDVLLRKQVGDISAVELFNNQVLCAIYVRPEKTKGGIYISSQTRDEDKIQGKVGLVIKNGPQAFVDVENKWFSGISVAVGDWIYFRPSDGWSITFKNPKTGEDTLCRIIDDVDVRGRVDRPDRVW